MEEIELHVNSQRTLSSGKKNACAEKWSYQSVSVANGKIHLEGA